MNSETIMTIQEYIQNPCTVSSLPYWKAKSITVPDNMMILHEKDFSNNLLSDYSDEKYFRLYHDLKNINNPVLDGFEIATATKKI